MNSLTLKIIAYITMIVDHLGAFFFPKKIILRLIGRISFPIFAILLTNTYMYTENIENKKKKFYFFGIITELILITLKLNVSNILFAMYLSLELLEAKNYNDKKKYTIFIISTILLTMLSGINYIYEVLFIITLYKYKNCNSKKEKTKNLFKLEILIYLTYLITTQNLIIAFFYNIMTFISLILSVKFYNNKYGNKKIHKILWIIYPLHFIIIYLIGKCI